MGSEELVLLARFLLLQDAARSDPSQCEDDSGITAPVSCSDSSARHWTALIYFPEPGMNRSPHLGHSMWSKSTRRKSAGAIECPHFGQGVFSNAFTLSRLIFCLLGNELPLLTDTHRLKLSVGHRRISL